MEFTSRPVGSKGVDVIIENLGVTIFDTFWEEDLPKLCDSLFSLLIDIHPNDEVAGMLCDLRDYGGD